MNPIDEKAQRDKEQAEQIIAEIPRMPEVAKVNVELYTDHTGDPAFELIFFVRPEVEIGKEFIRRFNQYAASVQTSILHSDLHRFPYTRLRQVA